MNRHRIRILALYPEELNIYADRGNLLFLRQRAAWRGIEVTISGCGVGQAFDPDGVDLIYVGGGQDRDQQMVGEDLLESKADAVRAFTLAGGPLLAVCGGFQLLGRSWSITGGELEGLGIFAVRTERGAGKRLIGPVAIEARVGGHELTVAGFENHAGRTYLDPGATPFGTVVCGNGNNGSDRTEGARSGNAIGTYLHGPLLPKNFLLADLLLATALDRDEPRPEKLATLDDGLEELAHQQALEAALRSRSNRSRRFRARSR